MRRSGAAVDGVIRLPTVTVHDLLQEVRSICKTRNHLSITLPF
jgi:hypothetical protein